MRWADPWWLLLLLPVAGLAYLLWRRSQKPDGVLFSNVSGVNQAIPSKPWEPDRILGLLTVLGLFLAVISLARPQAGVVTEEMSGHGVDIIMCLDTSGSMRSEDFKPQNRLGAAKEVARAFIQSRPKDRIGLVVFGGIPLTLCPLTADKRALLDLLDQTQIDMTHVDGTALGMALATSVDRLKNSKAATKIIICLTDGRNNVGAVDPLTAAKAAAALGIKVYTIGAGSPEGGWLPIQDPLFGTRYVRIPNDLDEGVLSSMAAASHGLYFRAKNSKGLQAIFEQINTLEKSEYKVAEFTHYRDLYLSWLVLSVLLFMSTWVLRQTLFRRIP
jgi:Ca-activated chloride channel homolog